MDLVKIGKFLQELRKEKGMTQEQLAEQMGVARRTVSRWETGSNMPDLDVLIGLADFYELDLREILSGERRSEPMEEELKETVLQVADYSHEDKVQSLRRSRRKTVLWLALAAMLAAVCIWRFWPHNLSQIIPAEPAALDEILASVVIFTVEEGNLVMGTYTADFAKGEEGWSEILWLLSSTTYRQDLRNPFLSLVDSISSEGGDKAVNLFLNQGDGTDHFWLNMSDGLVSVMRGDESGMRLYHPSDSSVLDKLAEYIKENGVKH